jgi:hypothetical protein
MSFLNLMQTPQMKIYIKFLFSESSHGLEHQVPAMDRKEQTFVGMESCIKQYCPIL